jgi:cyclopropane fatty-acyl-phospholipid synthase-like methyltransferase
MEKQDRFQWAAEIMDIKPDDHILEVGCGAGVAVTILAASLTNGTITAIDQSESMIKKASARNAALVAAGKAIFIPVSLVDIPAKKQYTKIFAFNVSVFWKDASRELTVIKKLLAPQGKLYIFHQPPPGTTMAFNKTIAAKVTETLEKENFTVRDVVHKKMSPAPVVSITAVI